MTSAETYNAARLLTSDLMSQLNQVLASHMERQAREPANWEFVGSLNEANARLAGVVAFLQHGI